MNFTREPIIETVITPREGCKLVLRSSKGSSAEDYYVDAIEVVSFGSALFYRSLERPKSFLLPMTDYEVLELKETRMVLKNADASKSVKIGSNNSEQSEPAKQKRRSRRKKSSEKGSSRDGNEEDKDTKEEPSIKEPSTEEKREERKILPPPVSKLLPPPPTLIKDKLSRYKEEEILDANLVEKAKDEPLDAPADLEESKVDEASLLEAEVAEAKETLPEDVGEEPEPFEVPTTSDDVAQDKGE